MIPVSAFPTYVNDGSAMFLSLIPEMVIAKRHQGSVHSELFQEKPFIVELHCSHDETCHT